MFCQSLTEVAVVLNSNAAMANNATSGFDVISDQNGTAGVVPVLYFPGNFFFLKVSFFIHLLTYVPDF